MENFLGNRSQYRSTTFNAAAAPGPYTNDFLVPQNGSISATSSESSLNSGLSDTHPTSTAASGNGAWRRFGPAESRVGFGGLPSNWNEQGSVLDDMALYQRSCSSSIEQNGGGTVWSRFAHHAMNDENGHESALSPVLENNPCDPSRTGRDSPLFFSLAPIQINQCAFVCPNCRAEQEQQRTCYTCLCHATQFESALPVSMPSSNATESCVTHRFTSYTGAQQNTPTKMGLTSNVAHPGFPSLALGRNGHTDRPGVYFDHPTSESYPSPMSAIGDSELNGLSSPSSSSLEQPGDIRAVNLIAHDQHPLRTWI